MEYDFNRWSRLAGEDPEAFDRARIEAIEAVIAQAPEELRPRLRALQCRIDLERRRAGNPLGACVRISAMMWDRFHHLRQALDDLRAPLSDHGALARRTETAAARVLPFPPPR